MQNFLSHKFVNCDDETTESVFISNELYFKIFQNLFYTMIKSTKIGETLSKINGKVFSKLNIHPNFFTALSIIFAVLGTITTYYRLFWIIPCIFFFLAFYMDIVDGSVARELNKVSNKGAFIDGVFDRVVETLMILSFLFLNAPPHILLIILAFGTYLTSFIKAYAEHRGVLEKKTASSMPGILERGERVSLLFTAFILYILNKKSIGKYILLFTAFLSVTTSIQRFVFTVRFKKKRRINDPKMIFLVRTDLKMEKGKIASQVAHAAIVSFINSNDTIKLEWLKKGQKKIVLKVRDFEELIKYKEKANKSGIKMFFIRDAGKTQVKEGEITVASTEIEESEKLDRIFKDLKLL